MCRKAGRLDRPLLVAEARDSPNRRNSSVLDLRDPEPVVLLHVVANLLGFVPDSIFPIGAVREVTACGLQDRVRTCLRADAEGRQQPLDVLRLTRRARGLFGSTY
jgi:hypothetical protein